MPVLKLGEKELWSLTEAAKRLGVTRAFLWRLVKSGRLATIRIGSAALVAPDAAREAVRLFYNRKRADAKRRWWRERKQKRKVTDDAS